MNRADRRTLTRRGLVAIAATALGCLLLIGIHGWRQWRRDAAPTLGDIRANTARAHIGEVITVSIPVRLPWHRRVTAPPTCNPPPGLQILEGDVQGPRLGWNGWTWTAMLRLQAYDLGTYEGLSASVPVTPGRQDHSRAVNATLPKLEVVPGLDPEDAAGPSPAGELGEDFLRTGSNPWLKAAVLLGVAAVLGVLLWRIGRQRQGAAPPPPPPWVIAEQALSGLEEALPLPGDQFFLGLTDAVRTYVEAVYSLPAREQTTPEFLREINRRPDVLSTDQRLLLTDFLGAADLVKFARTEVTEAQMRDALSLAKRFIVETSEPLIAAARQSAASPAEEARDE